MTSNATMPSSSSLLEVKSNIGTLTAQDHLKWQPPASSRVVRAAVCRSLYELVDLC
jgi:hypothetical protein